MKSAFCDQQENEGDLVCTLILQPDHLLATKSRGIF